MNSVDESTRKLCIKLCKEMQNEDNSNCHDDKRMGNDYTEGYTQAITDYRAMHGLAELEIDYKNNKLLGTKDEVPKNYGRLPDIFTV